MASADWKLFKFKVMNEQVLHVSDRHFPHFQVEDTKKSFFSF